MQIYNLKLLNFRNYESLELSFHPNKNIFYGLNGSGKTNIIEAIYMLGYTRTFRLGSDNVVIKKGKNIAKIEGMIKNEVFNNCKIIINETGKRIKIDNTKVVKFSDYISKISVILFNPDDLKLIKDTPSTRRKLLNIEISAINNDYINYLNIFNQILKQRNSYLKILLKKNSFNKEYLDILTEKLCEVALEIVQIREKFISNINLYISDIYYKITCKGHLALRYKSELLNKTKEQILNLYQKNISREIIMGKTLYGPQHDDLEFLIDGEIVKEFSSIGEQKNSVIAFKLSEIKNIQNMLGKNPILILDDLFSELDKEKINNILALLDDEIQTFITTTDLDNVNKELMQGAKLFYVNNGVIKEEAR